MMFGNIVVSGLQMIGKCGYSQRNITIVALSLSIGIGFTQVPELFSVFPKIIETVFAENFTENVVKTAFGKNKFPTWENFCKFIEERCVPRGRSGLREYLEAIGVDNYQPFEIVAKTNGRMAEDNQWIKTEKL